jgi:hypothetical protein
MATLIRLDFLNALRIVRHHSSTDGPTDLSSSSVLYVTGGRCSILPMIHDLTTRSFPHFASQR